VCWAEDAWEASECCLGESGTCDPTSAFHAGRTRPRIDDHSDKHTHHHEYNVHWFICIKINQFCRLLCNILPAVGNLGDIWKQGLEITVHCHFSLFSLYKYIYLLTYCGSRKKWAPNILHWPVQTCPILNKIKHAVAQKYLSYCCLISYNSIIPLNRLSIFTNCFHRFQLLTWLAYYTRHMSLRSRMTSFSR